MIGVAGSVAVGKSTASRLLQALLSRWPSHPKVDLITTDGFLLPQATLEARGLTHRKGFPESYDVRRLVRFMAEREIRRARSAGAGLFAPAPTTSCPARSRYVRNPDIVIVEGLNVLQTGSGRAGQPMPLFVSDFFDFSIYVDAGENDIEQWYVERFLTLRETVFQNPSSYFHRYARLTPDRGDRDGASPVDLHQPRQPAREHRAHARARASDPGKGSRPRRPARTAAEAVDQEAAGSSAAIDSLASSGAMSLAVSGREKR